MIRLTEKDKEFIIKNYNSLGALGCANQLGHSVERVSSYGLRKGLRAGEEARKRNAWEASQRAAATRKKIREENPHSFNVNPMVFIKICLPEAAYLLGYIWADGYIREGKSVHIECLSDDINNLKEVFDKTGRWNESRRKKKNQREMTDRFTGNQILCDFFIKNDYSAKSHTSADKILSHIPEHLRHYWWRGYFDGDGCFNVRKHIGRFFLASGEKQDWAFVKKLFDNLGVRFCIRINRQKKDNGKIHTASIVSVVRRKDVVKIGDYIYRGYSKDRIGLARKHSKWELIKTIDKIVKVGVKTDLSGLLA